MFYNEKDLQTKISNILNSMELQRRNEEDIFLNILNSIDKNYTRHLPLLTLPPPPPSIPKCILDKPTFFLPDILPIEKKRLLLILK